MYAVYGVLRVYRMCQCGFHVVLWSHIGAYSPPCCRTSHYGITFFIPISVPLWNDHADPVFDGVGMAGLRAGKILFYWPELLTPFFTSTVFPFCSLFLYVGMVGLIGLIGCESLSPSLAMPTSFNNNNNKQYIGAFHINSTHQPFK